jgi:hypothetical protein
VEVLVPVQIDQRGVFQQRGHISSKRIELFQFEVDDLLVVGFLDRVDDLLPEEGYLDVAVGLVGLDIGSEGVSNLL